MSTSSSADRSVARPSAGKEQGRAAAADGAGSARGAQRRARPGEVAADESTDEPTEVGARVPSAPESSPTRAGRRVDRPRPRDDVVEEDRDDAASGDPLRRVLGYRRQRFEARKVRRLIRHVDPWSMLKLAVLVALSMWLILMVAAVVMWTVARNAGTIANIESFVNSTLSLRDWTLDGEFIFRQFGLITLLLSLGLAASIVVASLVFNLISDIIGGVWVSVIEEETARPVADSKADESVR